MARLYTTGFELGDLKLYNANNPTDYDAEGGLVSNSAGSPTISTTTVRSGSRALALTATAPNSCRFTFDVTPVVTNTYYGRAAINIPTFNAGTYVTALYSNAVPNPGLIIGVDGTGNVIAYNNNAGTVNYTFPTKLVAGTWNVIEFSLVPGTGVCALRVNGVQSPTFTLAATEVMAAAAAAFVTLCQPTAGSATINLDDVALNDSTGAAQNSWCGHLNKVVLLKPTADSARVGWTGGTGLTTSLYTGVNSTPPKGVANASATATSQIKDATANTTDTYDATLAAYTTALASGGGGLGPNDTVQVAMPTANFGPTTAAAAALGVSGVSNPVAAEKVVTSNALAVGTFPVGWIGAPGTPVYPGPGGVTLGTSPVVRVRKGTSAVGENVDFMGLYVEYTPYVPPRPRTMLGVGT